MVVAEEEGEEERKEGGWEWSRGAGGVGTAGRRAPPRHGVGVVLQASGHAVLAEGVGRPGNGTVELLILGVVEHLPLVWV